MIKRKFSPEIANAINTCLENEGWSFTFNDKRGIFKFGIYLDGRIKHLPYSICVKKDSFIVYGLVPFGADTNDPDMMTRMAEFVCRSNYALMNGGFEFDFRDGEIRYKSYVDCEEMIPSETIIRNSIHCTAAMVERYAVGLLDILFTSSDAESAVNKCEQDSVDHLQRMLAVAVEEARNEKATEPQPDSDDDAITAEDTTDEEYDA